MKPRERGHIGGKVGVWKVCAHQPRTKFPITEAHMRTSYKKKKLTGKSKSNNPLTTKHIHVL